jgi:cell division protein FtsW
VKFLVPAYLTFRMRKFEGAEVNFRDFCKLMGLLSIPVLLILVEPNNGTAGVIGVTIVVMCVLTRIPFKYWAVPLLVLMTIGAISAYHLPYVSARLKVYLNPELDIRGKGHQPYQAKIAAGSGQLFGRGPGNSLQKLSYLPEAQNDYIAAIFAEEFGFAGMAVLIFLYMMIGYIGFYIAHHAVDRSGFFLAASLTFLICFQAFMNLGVVSGLLPSTGLNLPFFSQGGSSLMANMMGVAILLNVGIRKEGHYET